MDHKQQTPEELLMQIRNEMQVNITVGAYIFNVKTKKMLLILSKHDRLSIPKGFLNLNETYYEAAMREILEETGLHIQINEATPFVVSQKSKLTRKRVYFIINYDPSLYEKNQLKPIDINEIKQVKWFTYNEIVQNIYKCNYTIIKTISHNIPKMLTIFLKIYCIAI